MDFLDPAKKRAHIRRLFIGYFLMGVAIILAATILLVLSNGYDLDRKTGKVIQNGLIFTGSAPESAGIYLNGKANGETDERITVPEGKYTVELRREGYETWKKTLQLKGGSIERLQYPRLFPSRLTTAVSQAYDTVPGFSSQSPDRRWVVIAQPGQFGIYELFDTGKPEEPASTFSLPAGLLSTPPAGGAEKVELVEWSNDNRHFLVKHQYGEAFEFVIIDSQEPAASVNLNRLTGLSPAAATLRDKKHDKVHVYIGETKSLQFVDVKSGAVAPVLQNVENYKSYRDDTILFTASDPARPTTRFLKMRNGDKVYDLRSFETTQPVLLELAQYDDSMYVVATAIDEGRVYIYKDPLPKLRNPANGALNPFVLLRFAKPVKLSFSNNTRYISVQSGASFAVYDFEDSRRFSYQVPGEVAADQLATWMDGHRLALNQNGALQVMDFDGLNMRKLADIVPGTLPFFDRDYKRLFTLSPVVADPAQATLTRTSLRLKQEP